MSAVKKNETSKQKAAAKTAGKAPSSIKKIPVRKIPVKKIEEVKQEEEKKIKDYSVDDIWAEEPEEEEKFSGKLKERFDFIKESTLESENKQNANVVHKVMPLKDRSLNLYRKISISFILLTGVLLAVIFYFSFVKVDIKVALKEESVSNNLLVDIYSENSQAKDGSINGLVKKVSLEADNEYEATGKNIIGEEVTGKVKITNNYNKNQPLVATTRLQSADGKIYRIKDTVNVPANGSVEAEVYADQTTKEYAVGPTRFTIPGLWAGLQDKIYAENSEAITYQEKEQKFVQQIDIDNGLDDAKKLLIKKAEEQMGEDVKNKYKEILYKIDDNTIKSEISAKQEEEKDKFTVKINADVVFVAFNSEEIIRLANDKLKVSLEDNQQLVKFNEDKVIYSLNNFDTDQAAASVNVAFDGAVLPKDNAVLDKEKLVGLTEDQLKNYLSNIPEISNFEIKFSPAFIKKVPNLTDKINIETEK